MSCQKQSRRVNQAGLATGLSQLSSQAGNRLGEWLDQATKEADSAGRAIAPAVTAALAVVSPTNPAQVSKQRVLSSAIVSAARGVAILGKSGQMAQAVPLVRTASRVASVSEYMTAALGSGVAALSKTDEAGQVIQEKRYLLFFKSKQTVSLWQSHLTGLLNRRDLIGRREITASEGVLFESGGKSWHRGTITFKTQQGQRTITHLQGLSYPGNHYYFDRPISNEQAVGLATGQLKPERVPGFAGQLGKLESLCPTWAGTKRALILAKLHWGET